MRSGSSVPDSNSPGRGTWLHRWMSPQCDTEKHGPNSQSWLSRTKLIWRSVCTRDWLAVMPEWVLNRGTITWSVMFTRSVALLYWVHYSLPYGWSLPRAGYLGYSCQIVNRNDSVQFKKYTQKCIYTALHIKVHCQIKIYKLKSILKLIFLLSIDGHTV